MCSRQSAFEKTRPRECHRRARARWRAHLQGDRPRGPGPLRPDPRRAPRENPQRQKAARNRLPPDTDAAQASTSRAASSPSGSSRAACSATKKSSADWIAARKVSASQRAGADGQRGTSRGEPTVGVRPAARGVDVPGGIGPPMLLRMTLGSRSTSATGGARRVSDLIAAGERSISFEFFPPKDEAGERQLWTALRELEPLQPTFVSVTYGAGGTTRDRTVLITGDIATRDDADPDGAPDLRRPLARRAALGDRRLRRGRRPQRARAARRPAGGPDRRRPRRTRRA